MDENLIDALLSALSRQRDSALNAAAQLEARVSVQGAEIAALKKALEATANADPGSPPNPPEPHIDPSQIPLG